MIKLLNFVRERVATGGSIFQRRCQGSLKNRKSRPFSSLPQLLISPKRQQLYRNRDRPPPDYELIHRANITNYIYAFYPAAVGSMVLISGGWCYWKYLGPEISYPTKSKIAPIGFANATQADICYGFYILLNIVTLYFLRRTVLRVWHNPATDEYRVILIGTLPPRFRRTIVCKGGDVWRKFVDPERGVKEAIHKIHGRYYNMTIMDFRSPMDYYKLLGEA